MKETLSTIQQKEVAQTIRYHQEEYDKNKKFRNRPRISVGLAKTRTQDHFTRISIYQSSRNNPLEIQTLKKMEKRLPPKPLEKVIQFIYEYFLEGDTYHLHRTRIIDADLSKQRNRVPQTTCKQTKKEPRGVFWLCDHKRGSRKPPKQTASARQRERGASSRQLLDNHSCGSAPGQDLSVLQSRNIMILCTVSSLQIRG